MTKPLPNKLYLYFQYWLAAGCIMLLFQVILGGITRLTGSGLSITEWKIVTGTIPPLNHLQWEQAFYKYQQTPQYQIINQNFDLYQFKCIFFWEWLHRFWARLIGIVFLIGFGYFSYKKTIKKDWIFHLIMLFFLGLMQGAIGWIMVASGLVGDAIYVKPIKLAIHFCFAILLMGYAYWFYLVIKNYTQGLQKKINPTFLNKNEFITLQNNTKTNLGEIIHKKKYAIYIFIIIALLVFQFFMGALLAGNKAANVAPTWPTINGSILPNVHFNLFYVDKITIHFIHRTLGYIIALFIIVLTIILPKIIAFYNIKKYLIMVVFTQIILGISTILTSKWIISNQWGWFETFALIHQTIAICLFFLLVKCKFLIRNI